MAKRVDPAKRRDSEDAVNDEYERLEIFQVNQRRIVFNDSIHESSGGYGVVRQAKLHQSSYLPVWLDSRQYGPPQLVAVKQIKMSRADHMYKLKRAFTREVFVWSRLGVHPGISNFIGFHADFQRLEAWLISPWEPHGNINEFIGKHKLEVPEKLSLIHDTIDALTFLHQMNPPICHGDLKSANVLINAELRAVLCDFGLARLHEDSSFIKLDSSNESRGSIRWSSPELVNGSMRTPSSDIYAWAWLVWEIMTGKLPYEGTNADYAIIVKIFESSFPDVDGETHLAECLQVWELMTRCWNIEPQERPASRMCRSTVTHLPRCPPAARNSNQHERSAALLENLGDLESWKGNYEGGLANLEEALALYEQDGDVGGMASVLRKQAAVSYRHSHHEEALEAASSALEKYRTLSDVVGIAEASYWKGCSLMMLNKEDDAVPILEKAHGIFQAEDDHVGVVRCLERLGELQRRKGDITGALSSLEHAVTLASGHGDKLGEARALLPLGSAYLQNENIEKGTSILLDACQVARNIGWCHGLCVALSRLGTVNTRNGSYEEAERYFQESISVAREANARLRVAQSLSQLGECFRTQERLDEAVEKFEEACCLFYEISFAGRDFVFAASAYAAVQRRRGCTQDAIYWYDQAIVKCQHLKDAYAVSWHLREKAEALLEVGWYDEAALNLEASIAVRRESGGDCRLIVERLSAIPKTVMEWEVPSPLRCDVKKLQRRLPQLFTATLKLPIRLSHG